MTRWRPPERGVITGDVDRDEAIAMRERGRITGYDGLCPASALDPRYTDSDSVLMCDRPLEGHQGLDHLDGWDRVTWRPEGA